MSETAFLVLAHDNADHVAALLGRLHPHRVFLHIDAKSAAADFTAAVAQDHVTRVESCNVSWGGFSQVEAAMRLLAAALADRAVEHLVLLSGSCYPIRPVEELTRLLEVDPHAGLGYLPISQQSPHLVDMIELRWFYDLQRLPFGTTARRIARYGCAALLPRRAGPPGGLTPHFGPSWWTLQRSAAQLVLEEYRTNAELVKYYRRAASPDEQFVHTVVANSRFGNDRSLIPYQGASTYTDAPLHFIVPIAGTGKHEGPKPAWLDVADNLEALRASGKFFVRKIRLAADRDLIDQELLHRSRSGS